MPTSLQLSKQDLRWVAKPQTKKRVKISEFQGMQIWCLQLIAIMDLNACKSQVSVWYPIEVEYVLMQNDSKMVINVYYMDGGK